MKKILSYLIAIMLIFSLGACTPTKNPVESENTKPNQEEEVEDPKADDPQEGEGENENLSQEEPSKTWDESIEETIEIEGMKAPFKLNLYDDGFNFITYMPEDFLVETASSGEGDAYWFYANYQNKKVEDVFLHIFFFPETVKEEPTITDKNSLLYHMLPNMEVIPESNKVDKWAINEYKSPKGFQYAMLGNHEGRYFTMILRYPGEYADGFVPRANKIIDHLYWTDTNEYLINEGLE